MPAINWDVFQNLTGSADENFERLCRALIRCHYGRYGNFAALASQPGVEFHLKLHTQCSLGDAGQWFGWQCRWYDLPSGRAIGTTRRNKIEQAIATTEREVPGVTDWVLWTRRPLTAGDQEWFNGLGTQMRLHLWTAADVEEHLTGEATILRSTYFGELILTPDGLTTLHDQCLAPIRPRWFPEVHQTVDAERELRRVLGETRAWANLQASAEQLEADAASIDAQLGELDGVIRDETIEVATLARTTANGLAETYACITKGDLELLQEQLLVPPVILDKKYKKLLRQLRKFRQPAALPLTNALAHIRKSPLLLDKVKSSLGKRLVAVLAEAGCGKTQVSAQLTASTKERPPGVLLYGRNLHAGQNLNDLVRHIVIPGTAMPLPSIDALLAAVDAAGQRAKRRLPIVIDGLNEAEDPRDWKALLASLSEVLSQYPYVFVVCTLRPAFANDALPENCERVEIPDFGADTIQAIRKYFHHYRINAVDADILWDMLQHPLTLRFFCEVTNPTREKVVGIEKMPGSLTALFDHYLDQAAKRIADLAPRTRRYCQQDVRVALDKIGWALWEENARSLDLAALQRILGDNSLWRESIVQAMEQDGILLREPGEPPNGSRVAGAYDALAGHLVAKAILARVGSFGLDAWLKDSATLSAFDGPYEKRHHLAEDIFSSLVGLVPRQLHGKQLWTLLDEPRRLDALRKAADLEGAYLDAATVQELAKLVIARHEVRIDLLVRLMRTRGALEHPLNSAFLDSVLRQMGVAQRDLRWSEWIRRNRDGLLRDIERLEERWRDSLASRTQSDLLRARWVMWMLTSSARELRDVATRALYWYGRGTPEKLFDLAFDSLEINDPYVPERMLAASYGVAMARHVDLNDCHFVKTILPAYARRLFELMFDASAPHFTTHVIIRDYSRRFLELALQHHPNLFSDEEKKRIEPPYADGRLCEWGESDIEGLHYEISPFRMDFANYTLGRLLPDRRNYDFGHSGYQKIKAQILWRVHQLGWTSDAFHMIDEQIAQDRPYFRQNTDSKTDRYGKKYSWIAYFEMTGLLRDQGMLEGDDKDRWKRNVDIDPSFPLPLPRFRLIHDDFLGDTTITQTEWVANKAAPDVKPYLQMIEIQGQPGPWIMLDGYFGQQDKDRGRKIFCFIRSFLVPKRIAKSFLSHLSKQGLGNRWLSEKPSVIYTFAGEIPWCQTFPENGVTEFEFVVKEKQVTVKQKKPVCFLDGRQLDLTPDDILNFQALGETSWIKDELKSLSPDEIKRIETRDIFVEVEEIHRYLKRFPTIIPVCDFGWESYHSVANAAGHAVTLAKEVAQAINVVGQPQTFDLYTRDGMRVTLGLDDHGDFDNSQRFFFIKADVLKNLLKSNELALIWAIWGEREYYSSKARKQRQGEDQQDVKPYRVFQSIERLNVR
jgi:hypothetical protein